MKSLSTVFSVFSVWCVFNVTFWICLMCGVFCLSFFHGWWWHHTHPNRLHYCIKSLKVDITFLRLIILCSAHFQQRFKKKSPLLKWRDPIIRRCPMASGGLACLTAWRHTQLFFWRNFCPKQKEFVMDPNSNGLWLTLWQSKIFHLPIYHSDVPFWWWTILSPRQGRTIQTSQRIHHQNPGCGGPLSDVMKKIPGNANCEAEHLRAQVVDIFHG